MRSQPAHPHSAVAVERRARVLGPLGGAALAGVLALSLASCEGDGLDFATEPLTCTRIPASLAPDAHRVSLSDAQSLVALEDVLARLLPALPPGEGVDGVDQRLSTLGAALPRATPLARCLAIEHARVALAEVPARPETQADREVVQLTLEVLAAQVARTLP